MKTLSRSLFILGYLLALYATPVLAQTPADSLVTSLTAACAEVDALRETRYRNYYRREFQRLFDGCQASLSIAMRLALPDTTAPPLPEPEPPPPPPPPPPPDPELPGCTIVPVGSSIQAAVNAAQAGACFTLRTGIHRGQQVSPRAGNVFQCEPGAILDGGNSTRHAFVGTVSNVTVRGCTIQNYANPLQTGAIQPESGGWPNVTLGSGWRVEGNIIRLNKGYGVRTGDRMVLAQNTICDNEQLGVGGHGTDVLVEGNEICRNNAAGLHNWGWEAGGSKWTQTVRLVVRNNYFHDNRGPGIWTDINNDECLFEGNRVEDNAGPGIFHEISYRCTIRNNQVRRNALGITQTYGGAAGIFVSASGCGNRTPLNGSGNTRVCVDVSGNTVEGNGGGIMSIQQNRGTGTFGEYRVTGLWVHDNVVQWDRGYSGVTSDDGRAEIFDAAAANRFDRNTYRTSSTAGRFEWRWGGRTFAQWRGYGQDPNGSIAP